MTLLSKLSLLIVSLWHLETPVARPDGAPICPLGQAAVEVPPSPHASGTFVGFANSGITIDINGRPVTPGTSETFLSGMPSRVSFISHLVSLSVMIMVKSSSYPFAALSLVAALSLEHVQALPNGAPICVANEPAPPNGPHGASSGSLDAGGIEVTIGSTTVTPGGPTSSLTVGQGVSVTVTSTNGEPFRGILVRIPGATIDLPASGLYREGSLCPNGVGSITHTTRDDKQSVTFTLTMDEVGTGLGLDVNVLRAFSTHFYNQFSIDAVALPTKAPTSTPTMMPADSLSEVIAQNFNLQLMEAYLVFSRLLDEIDGPGPFTLFTPHDPGWERLSEGLDAKLRNRSWGAHLQYIMRTHIVTGDFPVDDLEETQAFTTISGQVVTVTRLPGTERVRVDEILAISLFDASNGYAYMLDDVLLPDWLDETLEDVMATSFAAMLALIEQAELDDLLRDAESTLTIFVPTDEALESATLDAPLEDVLRYHFVDDGPYPAMYFSTRSLPTLLQEEEIELDTSTSPPKLVGALNDATIVETDVVANNGLIHVIDAVLAPPDLP